MLSLRRCKSSILPRDDSQIQQKLSTNEGRGDVADKTHAGELISCGAREGFKGVAAGFAKQLPFEGLA